jgi:hypothetical protein
MTLSLSITTSSRTETARNNNQVTEVLLTVDKIATSGTYRWPRKQFILLQPFTK